jgi:hypothetical protein
MQIDFSIVHLIWPPLLTGSKLVQIHVEPPPGFDSSASFHSSMTLRSFLIYIEDQGLA